MSEKVKPKWEDCRICRHFREKRRCDFWHFCRSGEHFDEKIQDYDPTPLEMMRNMSKTRSTDD